MDQYIERSKQPGEVVKEAIADLEECSPSELGTLEEAVGVDALNSVVESPNGNGETVQTITFDYCGYSVEVNSNRRIHIET